MNQKHVMEKQKAQEQENSSTQKKKHSADHNATNINNNKSINTS